MNPSPRRKKASPTEGLARCMYRAAADHARAPAPISSSHFIPTDEPAWQLLPAFHGNGRILVGCRRGGGFVAFAPPGVLLYPGESPSEWRVAAWSADTASDPPLDDRPPTVLSNLSLVDAVNQAPQRFREWIAEHTRVRLQQLAILGPRPGRIPDEDRSRLVHHRLTLLSEAAREAFPYEGWVPPAPATHSHRGKSAGRGLARPRPLPR